MSNIIYKNIRKYYLEMHRRPENPAVPVPDKVLIMRANQPTIVFYKFMNKMTGGDVGWIDRQLMDEKVLRQIIQDPLVEMYVIYYDGVPAGFAEIDRRTPGEISMDYFGLAPDFRGKGLGKYFLQWMIDKAWSYNPKVFKLNTNEQDHPRALPAYLKAGFVLVEERIEEQAVG